MQPFRGRRARVLQVVLVALLAAVFCAPARAAGRPVVAVLDLEDTGLGLEAGARDRLTDYLVTQLTARGDYALLSRAELRTRLEAAGPGRPALCGEECRAALGKQLGVDALLTATVVPVAARCAVVLVLYDVEHAVAERGGAATGGCTEYDLAVELHQASQDLLGDDGRIQEAQGPSTMAFGTVFAPPGAPPMCRLDVRYEPADAEILVDERAIGRTPLDGYKLPCGRYLVALVKLGHDSQVVRLDLSSNRLLLGSLRAVPEPEPPPTPGSGTDWVRLSALVGLSGMGGGRLTLFGLKFPGFYYNVLEGGGIVGTSWFLPRKELWYYAFAGGDLGWLGVYGADEVMVGTLVEFAYIARTPNPCGDEEDCFAGLYAFGFGPIVRYRHYWGRFGLEVSLEWPLLTSIGVGLDYYMPPILGISVGM